MKTYFNKQVSQIVGITQRQVLDWSEKGLVIAYHEATSSGTKREYDYVNLLEFGLCKMLFEMRTGFREAKKIICSLRDERALREWAEDFQNWYGKLFRQELLKYERAGIRKEKMLEPEDPLPWEPYLPEQKPDIFLIYHFAQRPDPNMKNYIITPWEMRGYKTKPNGEILEELVIPCADNIITDIKISKATVIISLSEIKKEIDERQ